MTSGVPQGSALGPLLFTLLVSDIQSTVNNLSSLFADDTNIHMPLCMTNIAHARPVYKKTLSGYRTGQCTWKNNPNTKPILPTDYGTLHEISQTAEEKDLGLNIRQTDIFQAYIQLQVNKAHSVVELIRHTFKYLDKEILHDQNAQEEKGRPLNVRS